MSSYPLEAVKDASIAEFKWLQGRWKGFVGEDPIEEHWTAPANGAMMGMFRWLEGDSIRLYELIVLRTEGSEMVMRLRHFSPDLVAREEKEQSVEFVLVELREQEAVFLQRGSENPPWLIYRRESLSTLLAWFERDDEPPKVEEMFRYQRF